MDMTSYSVFSCVFLVSFVAKQNFCFPVNSSEEAIKLLKFKKIENATSNEKRLAKEILYVKEKIFTKNQEIADIQMYKEKWENIVAAVLSRRVLTTFFTDNVKKYLPAAEQGKTHTEVQIRAAYEKFINDTGNEVANAMRELLPGKVQEIPQAIPNLLRELSWYDQKYLEGLKIVIRFKELKNLIQTLPTTLREDEIKLVENIILIINRFNPENLVEEYYNRLMNISLWVQK